jgi:hypothetical protein
MCGWTYSNGEKRVFVVRGSKRVHFFSTFFVTKLDGG